jgi:hypothetical protein
MLSATTLWDAFLIQRAIFDFALFPSYSCSVISFRQLSRSFISPCEQVGEHHGGAGACLASGDSGVIRVGATDGGGEFSRLVAQPLARSIGANSVLICSNPKGAKAFPGVADCT